MEKNPNYYVVFVMVVMLNILIGKNEGIKLTSQGDVIDKMYRNEFKKRFLREEVNPVENPNPVPNQNPDAPGPNPNQNPGATGPIPNQNPGPGPLQGEQILRETDRIKKLPGQPNVTYAQYGGYITVDPVAGRAFYYYFVESGLPQSQSLFLWFNGGPGCSSLAYGAMHEIGPFRVKSDCRSLYKNPFSWNKAANLLFVESPASVGFSYSNRTSDYSNLGDSSTAADNYMFVVKWLERFPEFKNREVYMGGESYAGHYVPQLANLILQNNAKPGSTVINLKGILIGNPAINLETDVEGMFDYFAGHGLCSQDNINDVKRFCKFTAIRKNDSLPCFSAISKTYVNTDDIYMYAILTPECKSEAQAAYNKNKTASVEEVDPCSQYYVFRYINRPEVQKAMHANTTKLNYTWEPCNDKLLNTWIEKPDSVLPVLQQLRSNIRLWLFSGDLDAKIPFTATQLSLKKLNVITKTEWYPWMSSGEVGGYSEEYEGNITFATVRGAGHEVPYYQPERSLTLFRSFIAGVSPPSKLPKSTPIN